MSEEQTNFKVTDRRLFNPDGTPRDVPPDEKPAEPVAAEATATVESPPNQTEQTETLQPEVSPAVSPQTHEAEPDLETDARVESEVPGGEVPGMDDPASFANFMMSIASNAASALGMMEHPVTGKREVDLELGKHWIDILGMLQQKTRGNLLPQEEKILEGLLADLRMQYVSLTNSVASKARSFSSRDITGG